MAEMMDRMFFTRKLKIDDNFMAEKQYGERRILPSFPVFFQITRHGGMSQSCLPHIIMRQAISHQRQPYIPFIHSLLINRCV